MENKDNEEIRFSSVEEIADISIKWAKIEEIITKLAVTINKVAKETREQLPFTFVMNPFDKTVNLFYNDRKMRRIPMEAMLLAEDEAAFEKLLETYINLIEVPEMEEATE